MIRFLVGCLLAMAVLWAGLFTLAMCGVIVTGVTKHAPVHQPVRQ